MRSSKAQRLTHLKPGFYHPPTRPLFVPGWRWIGLLLVGLNAASGPPGVAHMRWWTTRGSRASDQDSEQREVLQICAQTWRRRVLHVWDRGYAGRAWLTLARAFPLRFVVRWPNRYHLLSDRSGVDPVPAWRVAPGLRAWEYRLRWDARRHVARRTGVLAMPVWRRDDYLRTQPLWLGVARRGQGQEPWYLLTSEPVTTTEDAWRMVYAYARRWQIELTWRYGKSELALESPRVWASGVGKAARNSCSWPPSPMPSCSPCCATNKRPSGSGCCATGVIARASGAALPQLRSTACAQRSAVSGWRTSRFLLQPSFKIRDDSCSCRPQAKSTVLIVAALLSMVVYCLHERQAQQQQRRLHLSVSRGILPKVPP